jgi:hypothetical protein
MSHPKLKAALRHMLLDAVGADPAAAGGKNFSAAHLAAAAARPWWPRALRPPTASRADFDALPLAKHEALLAALQPVLLGGAAAPAPAAAPPRARQAKPAAARPGKGKGAPGESPAGPVVRALLSGLRSMLVKPRSSSRRAAPS